MDRYRDRRDAGRALASALAERYGGRENLTVLALPRGGVPVGFEVATRLGAPLDVCAVRKLGVPGREELAMGAIASGGVMVLNDEVVWSLGLARPAIDAVAAAEAEELERREREYRGARPPLELSGRVVLLVDDGLATGSTMRAAVAGVKLRAPARIAVAVPVAAQATCDELAAEVDEVVCPVTPDPFHAVGLWYEDFSPTSDGEVRELLSRAAQDRRPTRAPPATPP